LFRRNVDGKLPQNAPDNSLSVDRKAAMNLRTPK